MTRTNGAATAASEDAPAAAASPRSPERRGKPPQYTQVVRGSIWFVVAVGIGAAGGLLYWSIATHVSSKEVVSQAGFLFAGLLFVNYATGMGIPVAVARFAPANTRSVNTLFSWGLIYTAVSSLVGTLAFFAVARLAFPTESSSSLWQWGVPAGLAIFFVLVTGQSFAVLVEVRLVTMRLWGWVMARVLFVSLIRLPLFLIPAVTKNPVGLLVIMAGAPALSGFIGAVALRVVQPADERGALRPLPPETRLVLRYATVNYVGMLAAQAPQFLFPLIVGRYVDEQSYGAFYVAWTITTVVFLVPHTVGQTVLSEGSRTYADPERQARLGLAVAGSIMVAMTLGAYVLGGTAVRLLFGDGYALAADILPRMVAAGIPWAVTAILLARARVYHQHAATVVITGGFALATLLPASLLAAMSGVSGAATAWLVGNCVAAGIAVVTAALSGAGMVRSTVQVGVSSEQAPVEAALDG